MLHVLRMIGMGGIADSEHPVRKVLRPDFAKLATRKLLLSDTTSKQQFNPSPQQMRVCSITPHFYGRCRGSFPNILAAPHLLPKGQSETL